MCDFSNEQFSRFSQFFAFLQFSLHLWSLAAVEMKQLLMWFATIIIIIFITIVIIFIVLYAPASSNNTSEINW